MGVGLLSAAVVAVAVAAVVVERVAAAREAYDQRRRATYFVIDWKATATGSLNQRDRDQVDQRDQAD